MPVTKSSLQVELLERTPRLLWLPVPLMPRTNHRISHQVQSLEMPKHPWSHIALDFVTGLPPSSGNTSILTVVTRFSKSVHFIPLSTGGFHAWHLFFVHHCSRCFWGLEKPLSKPLFITLWIMSGQRIFCHVSLNFILYCRFPFLILILIRSKHSQLNLPISYHFGKSYLGSI